MSINVQKAEFILSAASPKDFRRDALPQVAFAGRSNVGKSSVINRLLNRKNFARVGAAPGKTTQINYFKIDNAFYLVDLPGYGYARAAVLRAAEIQADMILLAKNIDGVYSADPKKDPGAVKYDAISYDQVLADHLQVMDLTATSLALENHIPVMIFALADPQNILRAVMGERIGTIVEEETKS